MGAVSLDLTPKGSVEIETLVNGPIQTNSYAVISNNECVIIDPAWEGERLVEHVRAEHPGVRVLGTVCTHGHADHVGLSDARLEVAVGQLGLEEIGLGRSRQVGAQSDDARVLDPGSWTRCWLITLRLAA